MTDTIFDIWVKVRISFLPMNNLYTIKYTCNTVIENLCIR